MNRLKRKFLQFCLLATSVFWASCSALKPHERVFVNDPEMQMGQDATDNFSNYVQSIREGATPVGNTKGSGGCGCN